MGTVLTSDIGFKVMKDVFKEEIEEYKYIEAQETIRNNTEKKERQQNWIKTLVNDDNEFCVEQNVSAFPNLAEGRLWVKRTSF